MAATASFVPSGTPVTVNLQGGISSQITLPAPDPSNLDMMLTNATGVPCHLMFAGTIPLRIDTPGSVRAPGQAQALLTANAAVLKLLANNPLVLTSGAQATVAQTATTAMAVCGQGCILTIQRGTVSANATFGG